MRYIFTTFGAALTLGSIMTTPGVAQNQSLQQLTNSCIELAMQRGWTESDIADNRRELRNFVARCIQGREARAQAKPRKQSR